MTGIAIITEAHIDMEDRACVDVHGVTRVRV